MRKTPLILLICIYLLTVGTGTAIQNEDIGLDTDKIEELTGSKGTLDKEEKVFKLSVPRDDIDLLVNGIKIPTAAGMASWIAFKRVGEKTLAMGDLILLPDQVNPVMSAVLDNGLEVTALHNHFLWESPRIMFMHIKGAEDTEKLASAIGKVFATIKSTANKKDDLKYSITSNDTSLDSAKMDELLGVKGTLENGVYRFVAGRKAKMNGYEIGKTMGINTWGAFMGSDKLAIVDGDFVVTNKELQKVLKALNKAKINITSIHQHMVDDEPRHLFVHYYGVGEAKKLAEGLRTALDLTKNNEPLSKD